MTVAAFMDLALYDPALGYYARSAQRSGRAGDFYTSVDVGPLFGDLLEFQIAEMADILDARDAGLTPALDDRAAAREHRDAAVDLVEAGAGNGRLSADILRAAKNRHPALFTRLRLHLVEGSPEARRAQPATLLDVAPSLVSSSDSLPDEFEGILIANELLDALPVHQVIMREDGLREVYVCADSRPSVDRPQSRDLEPTPGGGLRLSTVEGPPSTPALAEYLTRVGVELESGWRAEINLRAVEWIRAAARQLRRGFIILVDYGHEARDLYSASHASGTLTSFARHTMAGPDRATPVWLERPGDQDLTAHVDFTSVRAAAEREGMVALGFLDQTYFVLGLVHDRAEQIANRLALKTLMMPGGLGSTHKVLLLGKG
ncbi:MAG: SAM-dependent methyltransferase, partial [Acidobacteriota bacterium]